MIEKSKRILSCTNTTRIGVIFVSAIFRWTEKVIKKSQCIKTYVHTYVYASYSYIKFPAFSVICLDSAEWSEEAIAGFYEAWLRKRNTNRTQYDIEKLSDFSVLSVSTREITKIHKKYIFTLKWWHGRILYVRYVFYHINVIFPINVVFRINFKTFHLLVRLTEQ